MCSSDLRDRKGAKSTKISLSRGATFSRARSSLVVMLSERRHPEEEIDRETGRAGKKRERENNMSGQRGRRKSGESQDI